MPATATTQNIGRITQVIGSTFDVEFAEECLPAIYNAVKIVSDHTPGARTSGCGCWC